MELEYGCSWKYENGCQFQPAWLRSKLSDLEESTKSILSLQFAENEDSFAEMAETYYQKKSEIEERIVKYQQLDRFLLDQYNPVFGCSSISSSSTVNNFPKSPEIESSNSNPESCVEDVDPQSTKLTEPCEKNIPKLSEICEKKLSKLNKTGQQHSNGDFFDQLVDFEKRMSCSEELAEDNKRYVDELARRYEEKNRANKKLKEHIVLLMKENESLRENLMLWSEKKKFKFCSVPYGRIRKKISVKRMKGIVKRKISIKWLKDLIKRKILLKRFEGLVKRIISFEWMKDLVRRKFSIKRLKGYLVKRRISIKRLKSLAKRKNTIKWLKGLASVFMEKLVVRLEF